MNEIIAPHPFGTEITEAKLLQKFSDFQHWEERYRQLIMLSRQLPSLPEHLKQPAIEIPGCENRVWLASQKLPGSRLHFYGDSEGRIVRGLLAILLTINEGKTTSEILSQDPLAIFEKLGLKQQLSASRSSGLDALAAAIRQAAEA